MLGYSLTVPEAVLILGLVGSLIAVYKGTIDASKAKASEKNNAETKSPPLDTHYLDAVEKGAEALTAIAREIEAWRQQHERDKSNKRIEEFEHILEERWASIYSMLASIGESKTIPPRRTSHPEGHKP